LLYNSLGATYGKGNMCQLGNQCKFAPVCNEYFILGHFQLPLITILTTHDSFLAAKILTRQATRIFYLTLQESYTKRAYGGQLIFRPNMRLILCFSRMRDLLHNAKQHLWRFSVKLRPMSAVPKKYIIFETFIL